MKGQTSIVLAIVFALIVAVFAVINVDSVPVNFLFVTREAPLILVILISVLMGSIITAAFGAVKIYRLQREIRQLQKREINEETHSLINDADERSNLHDHEDSSSNLHNKEEK